jgi:hypothetical protein
MAAQLETYLVCNEGGCPVVCRRPNALERVGDVDEGVNIGIGAVNNVNKTPLTQLDHDVQLVFAGLDRLSPSSRNRTRQKFDVSLLMRSNLFETTSDPVRVPSLLKRFFRVFAKSLLVKCGLEMLKSQGKVENVNVYIEIRYLLISILFILKGKRT